MRFSASPALLKHYGLDSLTFAHRPSLADHPSHDAWTVTSVQGRSRACVLSDKDIGRSSCLYSGLQAASLQSEEKAKVPKLQCKEA